MPVSKVKQMADEEAARAEAENPDEPEPGEPEPQPEPVPTPDEEEQEAEEEEAPAAPEPSEPAQSVGALTIGPDEIRKAERARESYRRKIADVLGEEAVAHECVLCAGLGYLADLPPLGTQFTFLLGEGGPELAFEQPPEPIEYKQASDKRACPECDGRGITKTGAQPPAQTEWQCGKCAGAGWVPITGGPTPTVPLDFGPPREAPVGNGESTGPGPDAWGRPFGHQHYGVPPAMIAG